MLDYKFAQATELAVLMQNCYADKTRLDGFDGTTDLVVKRIKVRMESKKLPAIKATMQLIEELGTSKLNSAKREANMRHLFAACYYIVKVEPTQQGTDEPNDQ